MKHRPAPLHLCLSLVTAIAMLLGGGVLAGAIAEPAVDSVPQVSLTPDQSPEAVKGVEYNYGWVGYEPRSAAKFTAATTEFKVPKFSCAKFQKTNTIGWSLFWVGLEGGFQKGQTPNLQQVGVDIGCTPGPLVRGVYEDFPAKPHALPITIHQGDWVSAVVGYIPDQKTFTYSLHDLSTHQRKGAVGACGKQGHCTRDRAAVIEERVKNGSGFYPMLAQSMSFYNNTTTITNARHVGAAMGKDPNLYSVVMVRPGKQLHALYASGPFSKDGKRFRIARD